MELILKQAVDSDVPLISELAHHIWRNHYVSIIGQAQVEYMLSKIYSLESIKKQMKEQQEYTIAYNGDKPVGYAAVSTKDKLHYFLHKFYITIDEQHKGLGTLFFNGILNKNKSAESIELTVNRQNYKAINFYFKNGFVIKEVADFDIGNGFFMNDFIMIKQIS